MKMKTLKWTNLLLSGLLLIAVSSCGKIPKGYQGTFKDAVTGTQLTLDDSSGKWVETGGRAIEAKAVDAKLDDLAQGKPGLYMMPVEGNDKIQDVFWIVPDMSTKQSAEQYGVKYVWFNAERINTRMYMDQKDELPKIQLEYCKQGQVLLNLATQEIRGGCGPDAVQMTLERVTK
jgi:hypothetical protein